MNEDVYVLPPDQRPSWLEYPSSFRRIIDQRLIDIRPWHIYECQHALAEFQKLAARYPTRNLFPFAYRQDNEDVACWERGMGEKVVIIHDFSTPGWENGGAFDDVWSWFRYAVDDTIFWE